MRRKKKELNNKFEGLYKIIKDVLVDKCEKVIVFDSVFYSLYYCVTGQYGWTANMERIMKACAFKYNAWENVELISNLLTYLI